MHLGVDDRALACGLRPHLLRACGQRCAGDQRRAEFTSCQYDGPPCWRRSLAAFRRWKTVTGARQSAIPVPAARIWVDGTEFRWTREVAAASEPYGIKLDTRKT